MIWNPNPAARREILAAMNGRPALTVNEIACLVGKTPPTVLQMLYPMARDDVVSRERGPGKTYYWKPTGKPLAEQFTSTADNFREEMSSRYDHRALAEALGMNVKPPAAPANARAHLLMGGR